MTFTGIKAVGQALGMIAPLVVAKFFSAELFGSFSLARMVVFFFVSLLIASTQIPFIVFANQERAESGKISKSFTVQCVFLILSFCIFGAVIFPFGKYVTAFAKINYGDLIFVVLAFVGLAVKTFVCGLFLATGNRLKNALAELVFGLLSILLIFVFYLFYRIDLRSVFLIYFISSVVLVICFLGLIDYSVLLPFRLDRQQFHGLLEFTKWQFMGITAIYFINCGNNLVLRYFVPMGDIGVYNFGYQLFKGLMVLLASIGAYFLPFISQHINSPKKIREYLYSKRPKILLAGIIVIIGAYFVFPFGIDLIYGEVYQGNEKVFRILLLATATSSYSIFYGTLFTALRRYKFIFFTYIFQISINLIMNILLIPLLGISGAAVATVIGYASKAIFFELYFRLKVKKSLLVTHS